MGIESNIDFEKIRQRMNRFMDAVADVEVESLQKFGEELTTYAREIPATTGYTDQTGNLRSSTGYMVFKDGIAIHGDFKEVPGKVIGVQDGAAVGAAHAKKKGGKYKTGIALVMVAGKDYAAEVEARGKDVLTSTEIKAKNEFQEVVRGINRVIVEAMK